MENESTQNPITFEWHSLRRDLIKNAWAIVLAGLIAWMGIYVSTRSVYTPTYTSSATLVVRSKVGTVDVYSNLSTASDMAEIFTHVFEQPAMKTQAAQNIGLSSFPGSIHASVLGDTNMMRLSVTADRPEAAYHLLNSVLKVYPNISEAVFTDAIIDVLTTPEMPMGPSNSISQAHRGMIILLAMLLETGAIVLLSLLRNTVKNEQAFHDKIDARLLGTVVHSRPALNWRERLQKKKRGILINDANTELKFCEDYYKLATKLEFLKKSTGSSVFSVTSVAENEGKSTASVNLALALAQHGHRVVLLDMDVRKPVIYKMLGKHQDITVELSDVLSGKTPMQNLKLYRYRRTGLVLGLNKSSRMDTTRWISGDQTKVILKEFKEKADFVLLDTSPISVSADAMSVATLCDSTILLVRTDRVAAEDINDTILTLHNSGVDLAGCILNDVYQPFAMFGQMGVSENGYYSYRNYKNNGTYGRYGKVFSEEDFTADLSGGPEAE